MQLTTENNDVFINLWNENKPDGFVHPMRKGVADIIFYALELAEYTVNFENDVLSLYDNQTNEDLGNKSLKDIFDKAYSICDTDYPDDTTSRTFGFNILSIFENEELSPIEYKKEIRETLYKFYQTEKYFNTDEFLFNSIDYTTKNWVEIDNTYYEFEETQNMLSIGDSIVDLENIYGEIHFPDEAITDGKIKIFDSDSSCIDYLCEKHNLKDFEEIQDILMRDFDYPTKEVVEKVLPDFDNEQIKLLADIIEDQEINLEYITPLTFENIYFEIDESKLTDFEIETLDEIKKQLLKPTVEIFKQSFDSFIMSLSEAASSSIQKDLEKLKSKALYVFNVDNNEFTIVSKRDSENPFMVHKYYPENETGGIHHGSYDIDTYESAEKIAANRLINEQKEKYELINFIAGTREEDFNLELKNELFSVFKYLNEYSLTEENKIELIDVKAYQYEGPSGKLKVLVEYNGNCREDDLFNLLHDDEEKGQDGHDYEINGYKIDLNPIKAEKSGTISEYLAMLKNVEEKWPDFTDIVEVFRVNGILISEEDKKDFETFFNYHMEINTQSFFKKNEKLYLEDEVAGSKELVDKEFLFGKLESYIQNCNDSNDEYLQVHKNLFSKYIQEQTYLTQEEQKSQMYKKIYSKDSNGTERWREYDDKGNQIHYKDHKGNESWYEYNEKGNQIHYKDSKGFEEWHEYDEKGNEIYYKNSYGIERWKEYDDKGNVIYYKDSDGIEEWNEYDDKGNRIHFKSSRGYEYWSEYDDKGNVIHFKDSNGYETWTDYDNKGNVIYYKDSNGFERSSTVEYVSKEQYLQEKNNSQIETKYTKADINDLQSFFFPYPQLSESLCYQILDDFELYKIPFFKDSDGNIYQREMNTDLAEGDESDYQLLTQDGIIDQEYNWLIDRKYTPEDEIDLQKELEDIKKFEENPKSYYKKIFKLALEKEIEKVKKEINEGNVKDVIEKNILEIAEERLGSYASPEEIIGWYISDDEKNYFENWKNSGDFPDYKEALDSMFAYVYEHDTSKQNLRYISELNDTTQNKLKTLLQEHFEKEGLSEGEIKTAIQNAIDSKIDDLNQLMESNEKIKSLLTNEEDWQQVVYEWNERKQGTNSEFKPIGTLVEVNPSHKQQCESLRKNTSFIDIYDAELILGMINYDKDSFEFMLDIDNGNFVEIDRKNNKIIDVTDTEGALSYLRDEINYRTQDVVEESFTVEEIAAANRLIRPLEFIDNKNRQKIIEKNIYVVEEGLVTGSREPSFVPYNEFASKRLLDKTFTTKEACEVFCRKENAFQIAKAHIDEVDNSKEYSEAEKEKYVKVYFEQSEKNWDEYDNQVPSYKELEILIKGLDAFNHGEEALTFTRPDADDIENGFDNGWDFSEICKGYAEFADGYNESNVICRLDDMMIFDSDSDAAVQAKKDGYQFLEVGKDIIFPDEMLNDDIEYRNYIDTPENRTILKDFLRLKEHSISVDYAFPDNITYKKENGAEIKITIYEEPRWDFDDNNELLNIIKEADEDYYEEIKKIIAENPSRKFDFDLGKSLRYDDNTFYNSFHIDYSKETLSQKLDNKFIVRYWTTDDTFENKLPQISNFDFAGEDSTIIILNNEVTEKLNAMIRKHVKNNIDAFENYKTYRNEQINKVLYTEIKQHGEPSVSIDGKGKVIARFQTFTISNDLHNLLELPHFSWHDAQTGKSYPYQYALYADFELDENSIDETKEPEIKYFEFIDDGTKEIQSADSMKRNSGLLEQNQSIKEVITNTFKQVAQEYYNQNVSIELPVEQQNETTMQFTTENTKKTQMYKIIYKQSSQGIEEWHEYDPNGNKIHYKDSNGVEEWIEYDSNGNKIHYKNNGGFEEWYEYNSNGKEIHYKDSEGEELWYEYDSNGNKICSKDSDNLETHHEYDSNGNEIYSKNSSGYKQWYEYDSNGNKIHYKDSYGFERWYEYNSNGKEIHYKDSHSFEYWKEYDSKGNVIHYKEATGFERWLEYDSNGNHIYSKDSNGSEKWSTVEYLTKEQYLLEKNEAVQKLNKADSLTFGQFNSETNELKLIKEAYFKELVIDENNASKNKVILGFKENDQEQLLEMGEVEYKSLLNALGFSKEQQENTLEINKYKTVAEEKPEVVFDMIKSDYLGGTHFSDNELIGYLKGLKKSNNYHHYLDELLFESLKQSDESLFSKVVDAGADLTWRREENGEPINILHYAAADNLDIATKKIIEKTKSLEVDDHINLFSEESFEGHTPLEIAISNSGGEYFENTKLLIDAMDNEDFSGVEDLLIEDKLGNKVLYTSKDNLGCVSILCFDKNNNIISSDTESLVDEKSLGEIISQDLIYQTNNDFIKGNIELNRSSKLISELKEVPQKLWNDEINIKLLKTLPEAGFFNSKKDLYDFDSILALEKIKKSLFSDFDNQKESLLQGLYTKKEFVDSIKEKELNLEELNDCEIGEFVECLENKFFRTELAALCFDKKINELFDTISPRPNEMGMYKNNDYTCLSLKISAASKNRPITEGEAEIILKYIQYENFNFYESMNNELCMLDVSEDFTGEGKIMTPEKIVDMAHRMMVKARDEEYSIYDVKDEEVFNDLRNKFGLIEEQQIESSKDEKTSVVEQFFSKLKDSLYDNAKLEDVLKSAASVLQTFSDTEKKEISQYLNDKGASSGDRVGKVLSSILEIKEPGQKKKRSKADDDTRGR